MTLVFNLQSVDVQFGKMQALQQCSLQVAAGEILALIGANGSGKSTLLRTLNGLVLPTSGSVDRCSSACQAMVFQQPYLLRASVLHNVGLGLWLRGMAWPRARAAALEALTQVGLAHLAGRSARGLSAGQQQRVALARVWALQPQVLLLDEPTSSLDPASKREVERLMAECASAGMTLVFSSHNLGQVKRLASRVVYLEYGKVVADLPVTRFFNGPLPAAAARFLEGERV